MAHHNPHERFRPMRWPVSGLIVLLGVLCLVRVPWASADSKPVAVGDGFVVTQDDVLQLKNYMETEIGFKSTEPQHIQAAVKIRLFSMEAKALGLDQENALPEGADKTIPGMRDLSERYLQSLVDQYELDDVVYESFYRAHPDDFRTEPGKNEFRPLDMAAKGAIRERIMRIKRTAIARQAFKELMEKYHVRLGKEARGEGK